MRVIAMDIKKEKRVTCKNCGAIIGYYPLEVKKCGNMEYYHYINCPNCSEEVIIQ